MTTTDAAPAVCGRKGFNRNAKNEGECRVKGVWLPLRVVWRIHTAGYAALQGVLQEPHFIMASSLKQVVPTGENLVTPIRKFLRMQFRPFFNQATDSGGKGASHQVQRPDFHGSPMLIISHMEMRRIVLIGALYPRETGTRISGSCS